MPLAKQVILFVIDGLRPDALQQTPTPEIDKLVVQGAHTGGHKPSLLPSAYPVTPPYSSLCHRPATASSATCGRGRSRPCPA
ncbi:MAG TPA: hypothetical protein EYP49_08380 [Anaerolineae bacterium]|nr:hypothetical protein [Anaerolineae bacterium]